MCANFFTQTLYWGTKYSLKLLLLQFELKIQLSVNSTFLKTSREKKFPKFSFHRDAFSDVLFEISNEWIFRKMHACTFK